MFVCLCRFSQESVWPLTLLCSLSLSGLMLDHQQPMLPVILSRPLSFLLMLAAWCYVLQLYVIKAHGGCITYEHDDDDDTYDDDTVLCPRNY